MENVSHINSQRPGWHRVLLVEFTENDLVEITEALKSYHSFLVERGVENPDFEWPEVRKSIRSIIAKCYAAREMEDNDPIRESYGND